jgi:hypothetical protein
MSVVGIGVQIEVEVDQGSDASSIEQAIAAEGRRAARELYRKVVDVLDAEITTASGGARQRREPRWVATLFGRVRILRYRVRSGGVAPRPNGARPGRSRASGSIRGGRKSHTPLDLRLGLTRGEASPALRELVRELSSVLPDRKITHVVRWVTGESLSRQGVGRILEMDG